MYHYDSSPRLSIVRCPRINDGGKARQRQNRGDFMLNAPSRTTFLPCRLAKESQYHCSNRSVFPLRFRLDLYLAAISDVPLRQRKQSRRRLSHDSLQAELQFETDIELTETLILFIFDKKEKKLVST